MESLRKGLSGMDAARDAMGQGWPFAACPWSGDGTNEPGAKRRAGWRGKPFWFLLAGPAIRATAKRNPPSRAEPLPQPTRKTARQHQQKRLTQPPITWQSRFEVPSLAACD